MQAGELYTTAKALNENEKDIWKKKLSLTMNMEAEIISDISFEDLVLVVFACFEQKYYIPDLKIIAYGAGNMAQKYIPQISEKIKIYEIWDAYSQKNEIASIPIVRPEKQEQSLDTPIVVFIDDKITRYDVLSVYRKKGYHNLFYFRDYIELLNCFEILGDLKKYITDESRNLIQQFYYQYEVIENTCLPVLFSALKKDLQKEDILIKNKSLNEEDLKNRLKRKLTIDRISETCFQESIQEFLHTKLSNVFELVYSIEILLQKLLSSNVKTLERPMRMVNDKPYDAFAVTVAVNEILLYLFENAAIALDILQRLRAISADSIPLMASECYFLIRCERYTEALETARKAMSKDPNDLLANEAFYQVARKCKEQEIYVEEPIPEYDLSERFCWSGLNFVWCGGFNHQNDAADFSPCFRPLQCAARPEGEFWTGEDWKEFRKSVTDGSFRYCQKNQCPNIVAGWLPKKSECKEEWLKQILDGDLSVIPPIEELHFSYDGHCNLKCPSCRLEIQTITKEQTEYLDKMYEKNLKPYMGQAKHLTLSGCGEAMISPHSKKVLQSFSREKNPQLSVELRTNATTVNERSWDSLGDGRHVIRHITVSIDASTKESFEKLRYPAKWEHVLRNLEFIQSLRNAGEIDMFEFHVVIQTENINQLCDIVKMAIHYDADAVTFSRLINWRGMSEKEYYDVNPFWQDHPLHEKLVQELKALEILRDDIEKEQCGLTKGRKKIYINIHFSPDPNASYDEIRMGKLKIR